MYKRNYFSVSSESIISAEMEKVIIMKKFRERARRGNVKNPWKSLQRNAEM